MVPYYCCTCGIASLMVIITILFIWTLTFKNFLFEVRYTSLHLSADVLVLCICMCIFLCRVPLWNYSYVWRYVTSDMCYLIVSGFSELKLLSNLLCLLSRAAEIWPLFCEIFTCATSP